MIRVCTLQFGERDYFTESNRFGEAYCARHGYSWHVLPGVECPDGRDLRWSKVPGVMKTLCMSNTDFVFYLDADAVVVNQANTLDRLVTALGDKDLLIGEDTPGHINAGVWLVRPRAIDILDAWQNTPLLDPTLCHRWPVDEAGFNEIIHPLFNERIAVKTRQELNLVNGFVHHQMTGSPKSKQAIIGQLSRFKGL